jgi:hypothetical protein
VKPSRALVAALLAVTAGCSDIIEPALSGNLSFSHSGAITGTFSASGSVLVANPDAATWAAAERDDANQAIDIVAHVAHPSNTSDDIVVHFPQLTPGTVTVANGANVVMTFGRTTAGTAAWTCGLASGSVVVTSVSNTRVRGSFSGSGACVPASGNPATFSAANGSFDVPLADIAGQ